MATEKEIEKAQKAQSKDLKYRKKELARIEKEAYARRVEFVKSLNPFMAEPFVGPLALYQMRHLAFNCGVTNLSDIENIIDVNAMLQGSILTNQYVSSPGYLMLLQFVMYPMTGCYHYYRSYTRTIEHLTADSLRGGFFAANDLYDILIAMGYEMTAEERQWRDGTHPAYVNKPLEAFL